MNERITDSPLHDRISALAALKEWPVEHILGQQADFLASKAKIALAIHDGTLSEQDTDIALSEDRSGYLLDQVTTKKAVGEKLRRDDDGIFIEANDVYLIFNPQIGDAVLSWAYVNALQRYSELSGRSLNIHVYTRYKDLFLPGGQVDSKNAHLEVLHDDQIAELPFSNWGGKVCLELQIPDLLTYLENYGVDGSDLQLTKQNNPHSFVRHPHDMLRRPQHLILKPDVRGDSILLQGQRLGDSVGLQTEVLHHMTERIWRKVEFLSNMKLSDSISDEVLELPNFPNQVMRGDQHTDTFNMESGGYVVLIPFTSHRSKMMSAHSYHEITKVICQLTEPNQKVVMLRDANGYTEELEAALSEDEEWAKKGIVFDGSLKEIRLTLENSRFVIGSDTGFLHLAGITKPVIALYSGYVDPYFWSQRRGYTRFFPPATELLTTLNLNIDYERMNRVKVAPTPYSSDNIDMETLLSSVKELFNKH